MPLDTRQLINSRLGIGLSGWLGRVTPPWLGLRIARSAADLIAERKTWSIVRAVRANQWVVSGEKLKGEELDRQVRITFRNTARSIYELQRDIHNPTLVKRLVEVDNILTFLLQRQKYAERGLLIVGVHLGNFDFILQSAFLLGVQGMVLTVPELTGGYVQQFEMRKRTGMELVPATMSGMRRAVEHLKQGGGVITGVDRPVENPTCRPLFFGKASALPVHHIYLALKAQVPVIVVAPLRCEDGSYKIMSSEPMEMVQDEDRNTEILRNAEMVCRAAENFIRLAPEQWSMSFPVWPEALNEVEGY